MARDPRQSDQDDTQGLARLLDEIEAAEAFDAAAQQRFGKLISAAAAKPTKRQRKRG
jgi:hypothetical protein